MRAIALIGEPATGKSTLMRGLLNWFGKGQRMSYRKLKYIYFPHNKFIVLGEYFLKGQKAFEGTDVLSNTVVEDAEKFLKAMAIKHPEVRILFEGDRLTNRRFLSFLQKQYGDLKIIRLTCSPIEKELRHKSRMDSQSEQFKKRCKTKLDNLAEEYEIEEFDNTHLKPEAATRHFLRMTNLAQEEVIRWPKDARPAEKTGLKVKVETLMEDHQSQQASKKP